MGVLREKATQALGHGREGCHPALLSARASFRCPIFTTSTTSSPRCSRTGRSSFFENGAVAFEQIWSAPEKRQERIIAALEDKIQRKNEVVAELMEGHVELKKSLGNSDWSLGSP